MSAYRFTLYVAGETHRSTVAEANMRRLVAERLRGASVDVVDVTKDPERAESDRILTTPTLVKEHPAPARRVTGDLVDFDKVLHALGLANHPDLSLE